MIWQNLNSNTIFEKLFTIIGMQLQSADAIYSDMYLMLAYMCHVHLQSKLNGEGS